MTPAAYNTWTLRSNVCPIDLFLVYHDHLVFINRGTGCSLSFNVPEQKVELRVTIQHLKHIIGCKFVIEKLQRIYRI